MIGVLLFSFLYGTARIAAVPSGSQLEKAIVGQFWVAHSVFKDDDQSGFFYNVDSLLRMNSSVQSQCQAHSYLTSLARKRRAKTVSKRSCIIGAQHPTLSMLHNELSFDGVGCDRVRTAAARHMWWCRAFWRTVLCCYRSAHKHVLVRRASWWGGLVEMLHTASTSCKLGLFIMSAARVVGLQTRECTTIAQGLLLSQTLGLDFVRNL